MKIRAIRVAEVGIFSSPVALEGLSGALDVLSGPNEMGKSTLLRALQTVFAEKHTASGSKLKSRLIPYSGGAPLIEVEFELGGDAWLLRKRFFTARSAELRAIGRHGSIARNADAESELELLLSAHGGGARLSTFWVEQGTGLEPVGAGAADSSLQTALEREVASVASGSMARKVQNAVRKRLGELKTSKRDQETGALKAARAQHVAIKQAIAETQSHFSQAQNRLEQLAAARAERDSLVHLANSEAAQLRLDQARQEHAAAQAAAQRLAQADSTWRRLDAARALAVLTHRRLAEQMSEHAVLSEAEAQEIRAVGQARAQQQALAAAIVLARKALSDAEAAEQTSRQKLQWAERAAQRWQEAARLASRHQELTARAADVEAWLRRRDEAQRACLGNPVDRTMLARIEAETGDIRGLEAEIAASAPTLTLDLLPEARDVVRVDGEIVASDHQRSLGRASVIDIAGIGRITITPAPTARAQEVLSDLAAHHATLAALLDRADCTDLAAARARHAQRMTIEQQLIEADAQLSMLAPAGLDAILRECTSLEQELARFATDTPTDPMASDCAALAQVLSEASKARKNASAAAQAAIDAERADFAELTRLMARAEERQRRLTQIEAELPPFAERAPLLDGLLDRLRTAEQEARDALQLREALREATPDLATQERIARELASAERSQDQTAERLNQLDREIVACEAALERDAADGLEEKLAELTGQEKVAADQLRVLEQEAAALSLLDRLLEESERQTYDRYVVPATAALSPFLTTVFPAAELVLGQGFVPERLNRAGKPETMDALSGGTREQIAILARLGFAAIEAKAGRPVPVILDDALVYADDARIARMFDSLTSAARHHQVILLTCRERAFAAIGGNRLRLAPWSPAGA